MYPTACNMTDPAFLTTLLIRIQTLFTFSSNPRETLRWWWRGKILICAFIHTYLVFSWCSSWIFSMPKQWDFMLDRICLKSFLFCFVVCLFFCCVSFSYPWRWRPFQLLLTDFSYLTRDQTFARYCLLGTSRELWPKKSTLKLASMLLVDFS